MKTFSKFITEAYKNLFGDDPSKEQYADQVWNLIQASYAGIGGIKGSGFGSKQEMIAKIPMWKLAVKDGKVEVALLYKDKGGRKSVAMGSTGSDWAKSRVAEIFKQEVKRSYGEKSKAALGSVLKQYPQAAIEPFLHMPAEASRVLKVPVTVLTSIPKSDWPEDALLTISKYPFIEKYGYLREIKGVLTFKIMIGTTGLSIK